MAFEVKNSKQNFKKLTDLAVGDSLEGYLVDITNNTTYDGKFNLVIRMDDGVDYTISAIGNLQYAIVDRKLTPGLRTRLTYEAKKTAKKASQILVEQDPEDKIEVKAITADLTKKAQVSGKQAGSADPEMSSKISALKGN